MVSSMSRLCLHAGFILSLEWSGKTCCSTRHGTLGCPMPFHSITYGIRYWQESMGTFCQRRVGILMDNDNTSQSFFTTSFFQSRTSLKYNFPLVTRAFMIFHILPCKEHTLLCPPTSLPFILPSSQASSLSLTITPGIMSPFVLPALFDTVSWLVFSSPFQENSVCCTRCSSYHVPRCSVLLLQVSGMSVQSTSSAMSPHWWVA